MSKGKRFALTLAMTLVAGGAAGAEAERGAAAASGWIERGLARLEQAVARLGAKISGRGGGGCEDMMSGGMMSGGAIGGGMMQGPTMGGGMMGGSRPNERWRESERR